MKPSKILLAALIAASAAQLNAQDGTETTFRKWALTPPMGWNSWDCYGPTVVESEVKSNADYLAEHLKRYGWEYVVVDIRWFVENDKAGGYNQTNPIYVYDEYGRYTPATNRFPSAAGGAGFKPLADYIHSKGLKFGIHIMRGLPKIAATKKLPVKGTDGITCDMIASNDSACTWLRDNYKVDYRKEGAQEYYNSIFELYAEWGVDYIKIDDISRPYHTAEINMIRKAIDNCGRPIVLSLSPGETKTEQVPHLYEHANLWRTVDDFWDNWSQLNYQFQICAKWAPYIRPGNWPDADMLPLGKISIRGERGSERWTKFTRDEQYTMMNLWTIFKSPLMFGGDLTQNDAATDSLLTNEDVLYMHAHSRANRQVSNDDGKIVWTADDPRNNDKYAAIFNTGGNDYVNTKAAIYRSGTISYLTTGYATNVEVDLPEGSTQLALVVTDGGDSYDSDHADWINPTLTMDDGSTVDLTTLTMVRKACGWGSVSVNKNLNGGKLSVNGTKYDKGIATHANSIILYDLPEGARKFTALAGIDNTGSDQGSKSSVEFMVFNHDATIREETTDSNAGSKTIKIDPEKQAATSGLISQTHQKEGVDIEADITGANKLYLVVTNGGDGLDYDHADWGNPVLIDEDGKETSLTAINWDSNPINGWYSPKKNTNNDGNTMKINGKSYSKGFGTNAPSMLTFTLPEGHKYVKFKSTVGIDDDVLSAPKGATVEFRVFTQDPEPGSYANVTLDLRQIGFDEGQECEITEMWKGEPCGTYKNDEFSPSLKSHASGLYKVSPKTREKTSSVSLTTDKASASTTETIQLSASVSADIKDGYVQVYDGDSLLGTIPVDASGNATYTLNAASEGTHNFSATFSGNLKTEPSKSSTTSVDIKKNESEGINKATAASDQVTVKTCAGGVIINNPSTDKIVDIYTTDGTLVKSEKINKYKKIRLPQGIYIICGQKYNVR